MLNLGVVRSLLLSFCRRSLFHAAPVFSSLEEAGTVPRIAKLLAAMGGGGGEGGGDSPPEILSNTLTLVDALNSDQPGGQYIY